MLQCQQEKVENWRGNGKRGERDSLFPSTSLRDTSGKRGALLRAKKVSTGHFLTFASLRPPFRVPSGIDQKADSGMGGEGMVLSFHLHPLRDASGN